MVQEDGVSAAYGLAADEYFTSAHGDNATLRLYTYKDHCGLVGRFQNIHAELDLEACRAENVQIGRRLTGGGAIIMGQDQLGICLASHSSRFEWNTIRDLCALLSAPVVQALERLGVSATFRAKNDLEAGGKKIAGLGVYVDPNGDFHFHTSLLVDLDILQMLKILQIPLQKYADKQKVESVAQRITTVSREVGRKVSIDEMRGLIREQYEKHFNVRLQEQGVTLEERQPIDRLTRARYQSEEWLFQRSPQADMTGMSLKKTAEGLLRTYIGLKGETIKSVLITGDFLEDPGVFSQIEARLKWSPLDKDAIGKVVREVLSGNAIPLDPSDVTDAIWMAGQRAHAATKYAYHGSCYYPGKERTKN